MTTHNDLNAPYRPWFRPDQRGPHAARFEEHAAVLQEPVEADIIRRKDDLFDEGVSAIFGIRRGEAELRALCFDSARFTPEQAARWLLDQGWDPWSFQPARESRRP